MPPTVRQCIYYWAWVCLFSLFQWMLPPCLNCSHVEIWVNQREVACCPKNSLLWTWMIYSEEFISEHVINITLYLNMNTCNFLLCMSMQHFPYMYENFTVYVPELSKLWIVLSVPLSTLWHWRTVYLNGMDYKALIWLLCHIYFGIVTVS
jgi:hypothetical protein